MDNLHCYGFLILDALDGSYFASSRLFIILFLNLNYLS
jgi:hypothetical protein